MYVVSVHSSGGSTAEAVDPVVAYEVPDEDTAKRLAGDINKALGEHSDIFISRELWAIYYSLEPTPADAAPAIAAVDARYSF